MRFLGQLRKGLMGNVSYHFCSARLCNSGNVQTVKPTVIEERPTAQARQTVAAAKQNKTTKQPNKKPGAKTRAGPRDVIMWSIMLDISLFKGFRIYRENTLREFSSDFKKYRRITLS